MAAAGASSGGGGMKRWAALAAALALIACGPRMDGLEPGERARVTDIVDGDTLILEDGLRVTLTGIEAPYGEAPHARQSRAALERLALGRPAQLAYGGLKRVPPRPPRPGEEPRGDTALAHVFVQSEGGRWIWLQHAMLREGAAWVRTRRENTARAGELLAAEAEARRAEVGLWKERDYKLRTARGVLADLPSLPSDCRRRDAPFRIVEGRVSAVRESPRRVVLDFGPAEDSFEIVVFGDAVEAWRAGGPAFSSYEGKLVRAHGPMEARGGPHMCVDHAEQIEILAED